MRAAGAAMLTAQCYHHGWSMVRDGPGTRAGRSPRASPRCARGSAAAAGRSGRLPGEITLVAVTKTVPRQVVAAAVAAGQRVFGENRVQEALGKAEACGPGVSWHLIGHLQSNKAKAAVRLFDVVESLDSPGLAAELDRRAREAGRRLRVLVQVKLAEEATKSGVAQRGGAVADRDRGASCRTSSSRA